jgi:hypothetical protein
MRGVTRCQGSTGRMKRRRDRDEFKLTAVTRANARDIETTAWPRPCTERALPRASTVWRGSCVPRFQGPGGAGDPPGRRIGHDTLRTSRTRWTGGGNGGRLE